MPDIYGRDHTAAVENGIRVVKMDPATILAVMSAVTTRLGLGSTYSTTYYEPFHVARVFGTLDLMTRGRAAWNVVTSLNDSEAANFGRTEHLEHDLRYDRADEFMEAVLGHWDSWDDDAILLDKATGRFADAGKVRPVRYEGKFFRTHGPLPVPRSPQGHPVLIQAGQSGRGRRFAGRWGELIFVIYNNLAAGQKQYAELKRAVAEAGRDPDSVTVAPACYVNVAETAALAEEKRAYTEALATAEDGVVLLSEALNFDFASKGMDQAFTDDELANLSWGGFKDRIVQLSGKANPTVRDFVDLLRPRHHPRIPQLHRHPGAGGGPDGGMVRGPGLRRLRAGRLAEPGVFRGFHPHGGAGDAAPRPLSPRLCRQHPAREPRPATPPARRMEERPLKPARRASPGSAAPPRPSRRWLPAGGTAP